MLILLGWRRGGAHGRRHPSQEKGWGMGCFQDVMDDVTCMAMYWMGRRSELRFPACKEFEDYIDPACYHEVDPSQDSLDFVNMIFTEWLLFERPLRDGLTPLEIFIEQRPVVMTQASWKRLAEVRDTQVFSRFAIRHKDLDTNMCVYQDVRSGKRYDVYDEHVCKIDRWRDGTIAERIACVEDEWCPVAQVRLYDRAAPEETAVDGPGELHPEDEGLLPPAVRDSFYLRLARDTMGYRGRYSPSVRTVVY